MSEFDKLIKIIIKFTIIKNALNHGWIVINEHNSIILKKHLKYLNENDTNFSKLLPILLKQ